MDHARLVRLYAKASGISRLRAAELIEIFVQLVEAALKDGHDVTIRDFGTFTGVKRHLGTLPRASYDAKVVPKFQPSCKFEPGQRLLTRMRSWAPFTNLDPRDALDD